MSDLLTIRRVSSRIGKKCIERLGLFLLRPIAKREWLSAAIADQYGDSAIRGMGEKIFAVRTVGTFDALSSGLLACGGHQLPRAHEFVIHRHHTFAENVLN